MEIPGDGSKRGASKRLSSELGHSSGKGAKVRKVTEKAFENSRTAGGSDFSVTAKSKKTPFSTVSYVDLNGDRSAHLVHEIQIPHPPFLLNDKSLSEAVKVLNNLDYRVDLDEESVASELRQNLEMAKACNDGEASSFFITKAPKSLPKESPIECKHLNGMFLEVSFETKQGAGIAAAQGCRDSMEDRFFVNREISAVFDGHGGKECAEFAEKNFASFFQRRMEDPSLATMERRVKIFNAINLSCVDLSRSYLEEKAGTTANIALSFEEELWIANLGDSRALFVTPKKAVQLSQDQIAGNEVELIEARGGGVQQGRACHPASGYGVIPSRGFGDHHLKGAISSRPVITLFPLSEDKGYLVQASDGVFDVASSAQVGELVRNCSKKGFAADQIAAVIAQRALEAGSRDNITVIVKKFV